MTHLRLGELPVPDPAVPHLDGIVAVGGLGLELGDDVSFFKSDDGDRDDLSIGLEVTHHAQLGTHDPNACLVAHSDHHSLPIPAGRFETLGLVHSKEEKWVVFVIEKRALDRRKWMIVRTVGNWNCCLAHRY